MKKRIAVFTNGWSNEYVEYIIEGIRRKAKEDCVDIFVFATYAFFMDSTIHSKCQINLFHLPDPDFFDGAILLTNTFNLPDELERIMALWGRKNVPMISLEVKIPGIPFIGTDNYSGMSNLVEHLVSEHNIKKIVYIGGIEGNQENIIRKKAVEDVLDKHNLKLVSSVSGDFGFYTAAGIAKDWIESGKELPEAFVCANDITAIAFCNIFGDYGVSVPNDVIVTGFDGISESKKSFPMLTSVSRGWDTLGEHAYDKLYYHILHPDEEIDFIYDSVFELGESCRCSIGPEATEIRQKLLRKVYLDSVKSISLDLYFQGLHISMSSLSKKEDFYGTVKEIMEHDAYPAKDFVLCTEPSFFELDDIHYPDRIRGYSKTMDVLLEMKNGKAYPSYQFDTAELYPGYSHSEGESNTYLFIPLNHLDYIIGYVGIKNDLSMLYDQSLRSWNINMNTSFMQARQYIFSQQANEMLRNIYLTDFLTGMYNRAGCGEVLYRFVEKEKRIGNNVILLFADINKMKIINDVYGHLNGDLAIKATADGLRHYLGEDNWLFGRYGGDEFVVVGKYENCCDMEEFRQKLNASLDEFFVSLQVIFPLSVSVGYYIISSDDKGTIDDYIKKADESMYEQKMIAHKLFDEKQSALNMSSDIH